MRRRLIRHYLPIGAASLIATAILAALAPGALVNRISLATAYVGLALIAATLLIGPLNVIQHRPNPLSADLRRDTGILAAIWSLGHVYAGFQVHFLGDWTAYFVQIIDEETILRTDRFGLANHLGLVATVIIVVLLLISNDLSLRTLGSRSWKTIQRANYALIILVGLHGILYQLVETRDRPLIAIFATLLLAVLVLQVAGFQARRTTGRSPGHPPVHRSRR